MAADESNYNGKKLTEMIDGVPLDHNEALWFGLTVAQVKERFYLDYVHSTGEDGTEGFIGGCYFGSPNYEMHNTTRVGSLKVMAESSPGIWREYRLFWDGGLNTKGYVYDHIVISEVIFDMVISSIFKSSFHATSTQYGFRGRQRNIDNSDWEAWNYQYLVPDYPTILKNNQIRRSSWGFGSDRKGVHFQIQAFITNNEGTYFAEPVEILPKAKSFLFANSTIPYYIDTPDIGVGTKLYANEDFSGYFSGPSGSGNYWIDDRYYWRYGYDVESDTWMFIERIDTNNPGGGGPQTPTAFTYKGYSSFSQADAANQVVQGANQNTGTLYFNSEDERWYQSYSGTYPNFIFSNKANDGYYADGDLSGVNQEKYLIDGMDQ